MRAECLPAESTFVPTRHDVITQLREHAHRNGLLDVEFEIREGDGFVRGLARGLKTISGNAATYEVHLLTDGASAMSLVAGGVSSSYPQPGIYEFLNSGRHLPNEAR
jgi:hypothetical protein